MKIFRESLRHKAMFEVITDYKYGRTSRIEGRTIPCIDGHN